MPPGPPPLPGDTPPAPGYWKASDGNWYPPQSAPGTTAVPPPPGGHHQQVYQQPGYQQPGYQQPGQVYGAPGYGGYAPAPSNGIATASLVLGIISIVLFWTFGFGVLLGILAIIFGVMGRNRAKEQQGAPNAGRATAGLITGILGTIGGVLFFVVLIPTFTEVLDEIDSDIPDGFCDQDRFLQDPDC